MGHARESGWPNGPWRGSPITAALTADVAAGGIEARPAADYAFLYQRQLTDPDGHALEFGHMNTDAAE